MTDASAFQSACELVEHNFGRLLDAMPDGIIIADASGTIVSVNVEAEKLFGQGRGDLVSNSLLPLNVGTTRGIVADEDDGKTWRSGPAGHEFGDLPGQAIAQLVCQLESVHNDGFDAFRSGLSRAVRHLDRLGGEAQAADFDDLPWLVFLLSLGFDFEGLDPSSVFFLSDFSAPDFVSSLASALESFFALE